MRSAAEMIEVVCPECGEEYVDWYRPGEGAAHQAICPSCGYDISSDPAMREEGGWSLLTAEDELRDH